MVKILNNIYTTSYHYEVRWVTCWITNILYIVNDLNLVFSSFLLERVAHFLIFSYWSYENRGWNGRPCKALTQDIVVKMRQYEKWLFFHILYILISPKNVYYFKF